MATTTMASGMNARDYQHKRFRNNNSSLTASPQRGDSSRVVTPVGSQTSGEVEEVSYGHLSRQQPYPSRSEGSANHESSTRHTSKVSFNVLSADAIRQSEKYDSGDEDQDPAVSVPMRISISESQQPSTTSLSTIGSAPSVHSLPEALLSNDSGAESSSHTSNSRISNNPTESTVVKEMRRIKQAWADDDEDYSSPMKPQSMSTVRTDGTVVAARSPASVSISSSAEKHEQFVHRPTAKGLAIMGTSPPSKLSIADQRERAAALRYSLVDGKKAMSEDMLKRSQEVVDSAATRQAQSRLRAIHSLALQQPDPTLTTRTSSSQIRSSRSRSSPKSSDSFKIFLLLLQPKTKIFELIQIMYSPQGATIGDLLDMIPDNATEAALGSQAYIGLCRPDSKDELLDRNLLASECPTTIDASYAKEVPSAKIKLGEILVAIPEGYSGEVVSNLSKHILANPKIIKLLKRSDPLAPTSRRHSKRSSRGSKRPSRPRRSQRRSIEILDKHDEEEEIRQEKLERNMHEAMAHAAMEAAAANAAIPSGDEHEPTEPEPAGDDSKSLTDLSTQDSIDESYSSWSKSFEQSFSAQSSVCSGVSTAARSVRRKERHARRMVLLQRMGGVAFVLMIILYFLDPRGYASKNDHSMNDIADVPMGISGVFQCLFLLLTLYKVERLARRSTSNDNQQHPPQCPFLRASAAAMDSLRNKYQRKMKRQKQQHTSATNNSSSTPPRRRVRRVQHDEPASLRHRLREFSIQAGGEQSLQKPKEYY